MRAQTMLLVVVGCIGALSSGCGGDDGATETAQRYNQSPDSRNSSPRFVRALCESRSRPAMGVGWGADSWSGPRLVATVEHVVDGASRIDLKRDGKSVASGTVIGADKERDIALIRTDRPVSGYVFQLEGAGTPTRRRGRRAGVPARSAADGDEGVGKWARPDDRDRGDTASQARPDRYGAESGQQWRPADRTGIGKVVGLVDAGNTEANGIAWAVNSRVAAAFIEAWKTSPQPVSAPSCGGPPVTPRPGPGGGGGAGERQLRPIRHMRTLLMTP